MAKKVFYDESKCSNCDACGEVGVCFDCRDFASNEFYEAFRKLAPKADKVVIVAHNSNWQGRTGYLIVDFNNDVLRNICSKTTSFVKQFYRDGRKMYVIGRNHDVPTGGVWELIPVISRGRNNDALIQSVINKSQGR